MSEKDAASASPKRQGCLIFIAVIVVLGVAGSLIGECDSSPSDPIAVDRNHPTITPVPTPDITRRDRAKVVEALNLVREQHSHVPVWNCEMTQETDVWYGACMGEGLEPRVELTIAVLVTAMAGRGHAAINYYTLAYDKQVGTIAMQVKCDLSTFSQMSTNLRENCTEELVDPSDAILEMAATAIDWGITPK